MLALLVKLLLLLPSESAIAPTDDTIIVMISAAAVVTVMMRYSVCCEEGSTLLDRELSRAIERARGLTSRTCAADETPDRERGSAGSRETTHPDAAPTRPFFLRPWSQTFQFSPQSTDVAHRRCSPWRSHSWAPATAPTASASAAAREAAPAAMKARPCRHLPLPPGCSRVSLLGFCGRRCESALAHRTRTRPI